MPRSLWDQGECRVRFPGLAAALLLAGLTLTAPMPLTGELPDGHRVDQKEVCSTCHEVAEGPEARFQHRPYETGRCSACHNTLFSMEAGTDTLTMAEMSEGRACGACHDGDAAFGLMECNSCHPPESSAEALPDP